MAVLEAALLNKTIIAYKAGGITEILRDYEKSVLIEPNNKKDFAKAIVFEFHHPKKQVDISSLKQKFSKEQLIEKNIKIYEKVLA